MAERRDRMDEEAIGWAIRAHEPAFDDWDGLTAWLEADPAHAEAYDHAVLAADNADPVLRQQPAPIIRTMPRRGVLGWAGGAIAASLVAVAGWTVLADRAQPFGIETRPGETRTIALADGSNIAMNGATRLVLDRADARIATLERGEALFTIVHDDSDPFIVHTGGAVIEDVGTIFNVARDAGVTRVAVAEGAVVYNPRGEAVTLVAGQTLSAADDADQLRVGREAAADIGGWRQGRLVYEGAPLALVAADLSRATGTNVAVAPEIAAKPFTGVIAVGADRARFVDGLGPLLDVNVRRGEQGVVLSPRARAAR